MRTYFYNDETGRLRKYLHCTRGCPENYTQSDIGLKIFKVNQSAFICKKCLSVLEIKCDMTNRDQKVRVKEEYIETYVGPSPKIKISELEELKENLFDNNDQNILEEIKESIFENKEEETNLVVPQPESLSENNIEIPLEIEEPKINESPCDNIHEVCAPENDKSADSINVQTEQTYVAYVLLCKDNTYYLGITTNLQNAVKYHNSGCGSAYTKPKERRPVTVVETVSAASQGDAKKIKEDLHKKYKRCI